MGRGRHEENVRKHSLAAALGNPPGIRYHPQRGEVRVLTLRPYQEDALASVTRAYARGISRPLIALPTGTGKTVVFSHLVQQRPGRC